MIVPARKGLGLHVKRGQQVRVINTYGTQVVDVWAFNDADPSEFMAMEHSRVTLGRWRPILGNTLVTNRRRPILKITEDTTPGIHDTVCAACDRYRYELLGHKGYHDSCSDNLATALKDNGISTDARPQPLNLFMVVDLAEDGELIFRAPVSQPGQYVTLRAEMDCLVAFSSCPQDIVTVNGAEPKSVEVALLN